MDLLTGITENFKAPIDKDSIDGKVEVVEGRLNGKILPFAGLHGMILTLFYLIDKSKSSIPADEVVPLWLRIVMGAVILISVAMTIMYHLRGRGKDAVGGASVAAILAMISCLLLPTEAIGIGFALAIFSFLLILNAQGWVSDYETNTVVIYLPFIFYTVRDLSVWSQLLSAIVLFSGAVYLKFRIQPESNKVPLGFSILTFLSMVIIKSSNTEILVGFLVLLALILFILYSFSNRRAGSSYRHFLFDTIIMGLWGSLVATFGIDSDTGQYVLWGFGVVIYQSIAIGLLKIRETNGPGMLAVLDARLAWIQIGTFVIFYNLLPKNILNTWFGVDSFYPVALTIFVVFVPVYRILKCSFLALTTRTGIGISLLFAVFQTSLNFQTRYPIPANGITPDELRLQFFTGYQTDLFWILFAYLAGMAATLRVPPVIELAWWQGLIWPRHMVIIRHASRLVFANISRIPFIGGLFGMLVALFKWMDYAGGKKHGVGSRDLMLLSVHVFGVAMTILFGRYYQNCCEHPLPPILSTSLLNFANGDIIYVLSWCLWGTLLYLYGVVFKDYLARFFATAFAVMPLVMFAANNSLDNMFFFAKTVLVCSFSLFSFGLFRRISG